MQRTMLVEMILFDDIQIIQLAESSYTNNS